MTCSSARWIFGPAIALAMTLALPAQATTVIAVPLERMTQESEVIVHARVGAQQVTWDAGHQRILTLTTILIITQSLKSPTIRLRTVIRQPISLDHFQK